MSEFTPEDPTEWRPLTDQERELLEALTSQDFTGAGDLRHQIDYAQAQRGCNCGCGTIDLRVDRAHAPPAPLTRQPAPGEANVVDDNGDTIAGLILFTNDGYLSSLEIYFAGDPLPLPELDRIRPYVISDG
ncbi:MAG: hypothetical protein QNJ12_22375 [Ilumatobacter sp.]|uniref:hypothetical protein n=1 Tax=Ilumatobacter sp. TaxID=1967498 RepID=UPI00261465EB|nr:hypothetical protein [Ilumatobacter sp.]MDJ0771549.1 hypothetical protein [Ilumatobacter sp.]